MSVEAIAPVVRNGVYHVGAVRGLDAMAEMARGARESITAELFKLDDPAVVASLRSAVDRRIPIRLHADTQYLREEYAIGAADGLVVTEHGRSPLKLHTKVLVADHDRAISETAAPVRDLRELQTIDFAVEVQGDAARALERATAAAASGRSSDIRRTAHELAEHGFLLNDPAHGVTLLRDALERGITSSKSSIYYGTKLLGDERGMHMLARRRGEGLRVLVETSPKSDDSLLTQARDIGLDVSALQRKGLHGNITVFDERLAYFGTTMLSPRGMARSTSPRDARELGWFTTDRAAISSALDAIQRLDGSRLERFRGTL